ncbi:MAG: hypothetical protein ACLVDB_04095 [Anaeromassilibacillus sp.]
MEQVLSVDCKVLQLKTGLLCENVIENGSFPVDHIHAEGCGGSVQLYPAVDPGATPETAVHQAGLASV